MHKFNNFFTKILGILIIFSISFCFWGCTKNEKNFLDNTIAIVYRNNIPYLINDKNETFSLEKYDLVVPYFDDILIVKKNNQFGYIKNSGEILIEPQFDEAYPFSEGKAVVSKNNLTYIIDITGQKIFELESGYTSIGSFSCDLLVISNSTGQGYLRYDKDINDFYYLYNIKTISEDGTTSINHTPYNYCGQFKNEYAVIGFYNQNNQYKYSHINLEGKRLYDYEWDYAGEFYEGFAVVGNNSLYTQKIYCSKERLFDSVIRKNFNHRPLPEQFIPTVTTMTYMYITPTGRYLGSETTDYNTGETTFTPYTFAQAGNFKNSIAIVSDLCYLVDSYSQGGNGYKQLKNRYFNNYNAIDTNGDIVLAYPIGYKNYWGEGIICSYNDIFILDNIYIASFKSYDYQTLYFDNDEDAIGTFKTANVDIKTDEYWIDEYIKNFTNGKVQPGYVIDHAIPYNQTLYKQSKFLNNEYVAKTQISSGFKDSCGLTKLSIVEGIPTIKYVIPPLYDNIIF